MHFYLGERLMADEPIYVPTYLHAYQNLLRQLQQGFFEFDQFETPEQAYKTLLTERATDERPFFRYLFKVDETLDSYMIFLFQKMEECCFVWTCWDAQRCNADHQWNVIYTIQLPQDALMTIIRTLLDQWLMLRRVIVLLL